MFCSNIAGSCQISSLSMSSANQKHRKEVFYRQVTGESVSLTRSLRSHVELNTLNVLFVG